MGSACVVAPSVASFAPGQQLDLGGFSHLVVDEAHQHVFLSQGTDSVVVTDLAGATTNTIGSLPGSTDMVLDSSGGQVWVAVSGGAELASIDTATLQVKPYPTGAGTCPDQVAEVDTDVWFIDGCGSGQAHLRRLDPTTGDVDDAGDLGQGALIAGSPGAPGTLFVQNPASVGLDGYADEVISSLDVSDFPGQAPTTSASYGGGLTSVESLPTAIEVTPDGAWLVTDRASFLDTATMTDQTHQFGGTTPVALAVRGDGQVALAQAHELDGYVMPSQKQLAPVKVSKVTVPKFGISYGDHDLYVVTQGSAGYQLTHTPLRAVTSMNVAGPDGAKYGRVIKLTVKTKGIPVGSRIDLSAETDDFPPRLVAHATVGGDGRAHLSYRVDTEQMKLVASYAGDPDHEPVDYVHDLYVTSIVSLKPTHDLGKRHGETRFKAGKRAHFVVKALPATRENVVYAALFRRIRGHWVEVGDTDRIKVPKNGRIRIFVARTGALVGVHFRVQAGMEADRGAGWEARSHLVRFTFVR